jgi:FkbM family methyltransferase
MKAKLRFYQMIKLIKILRNLKVKDIFHLLCRASEGPPKLSVVGSKFGVFSGFGNDYMFRSAIDRGSNESHFELIIKWILTRSSNALDLGANIGTHSILMSKICDRGHIFSFEPQSLTFSVLQNNLLLNKSENVTAYRFAVTDIDGQILAMEPFSYGSANINNGGLSINTSGGLLGDLVISRTIDSFRFPKIDFVKIDIQGSECKAIIGMKRLLEKDRPFIFLEIEELYLNSLGASSKELIEHMLSLDYILYRINSEYPCDHLCVPLEKEKDIDLFISSKDEIRFSKISGKKVNLKFKSSADQLYSELDITRY